MTLFRGVVWAVGPIFLFLLVATFGQPFPKPILYVTGKLRYNDSLPNVVSDSFPNMTRELLMVNYNPSVREWDFRNITFVSMQTISGAMVVDETEIYTFGFAPLTGHNQPDRGGYLAPKRFPDFSPYTILNLSSTDTFTVALISNGSVYVWGSSDRRKYIPNYASTSDQTEFLGLGNTVNAFGIQKIDHFSDNPTPTISKLFTGTAQHTFAFDNETRLWGWGLSDLLPYHLPNVTKVPALLNGFDGLVGDITQISAVNHAVAVLKNGSYLCWGAIAGNACGNDAFSDFEPYTYQQQPKISNNSVRHWVKVATGFGFTYALANDSTLWAWGTQKYGGTYAPIQNNSACNETLDSGNVTSCHTHQVFLAPHRRNAKIIDILDSFHFIFAMTDLGEIYLIAADGFGPGNTSLSWRPFPYSIPNGHAIDFSRSQTSSSTIFFLTKLVQPCPEPKPFLGDSANVICNNGVWILIDESVDMSSDITLDSPIVITGNMNVSSPITITTPIQSNSGKPLLTAENCIAQMENLQFELQLTDDQLKQSKIDPIVLIDLNASCSFTTLLETQISQPNNCRKAAVSLQSSTTASGRTQIQAIFTLDKSSCNTWWIILVSVVGGVILLAIFIALLFTFNKTLRDKCRPFAKRNNPEQVGEPL